jgi:hypothetical protein
VDDWIGLSRSSSELLEDRRKVRVREKLNEIVHVAYERLIVEIRPSDRGEEPPQEWVGPRNLPGSVGAPKLAWPDVPNPCSEQAVGERLGEHVSKLTDSEVRQENLRKRSAQVSKKGGRSSVREARGDRLADQVGEVRHPHREIPRFCDRKGSVVEECHKEGADVAVLGPSSDVAPI